MSTDAETPQLRSSPTPSDAETLCADRSMVSSIGEWTDEGYTTKCDPHTGDSLLSTLNMSLDMFKITDRHSEDEDSYTPITVRVDDREQANANHCKLHGAGVVQLCSA